MNELQCPCGGEIGFPGHWPDWPDGRPKLECCLDCGMEFTKPALDGLRRMREEALHEMRLHDVTSKMLQEMEDRASRAEAAEKARGE